MPAAGFEPAIPATKRPQTYALDLAATGIGSFDLYHPKRSGGISTRYNTVRGKYIHHKELPMCLK
jgi:hypothetical protein